MLYIKLRHKTCLEPQVSSVVALLPARSRVVGGPPHYSTPPLLSGSAVRTRGGVRHPISRDCHGGNRTTKLCLAIGTYLIPEWGKLHPH